MSRFVEILSPESYWEISFSEVKKWVENENFAHFIGLIAPPMPGVELFSTMLEFKHFPPRTAKNKRYRVIGMEFQRMGWNMVSIPMKDMPIAQKVARECGVSIGPAPRVAESCGRRIMFPVQGKTVYELIYFPYHYPDLSFPEDFEEILRREQVRIEQILFEASGAHVAYI